VYDECNNLGLCGHIPIKEVRFTISYFYLVVDDGSKDFFIEITFQINENKQRQVKRIFDIIFEDYDSFENELTVSLTVSGIHCA